MSVDLADIKDRSPNTDLIEALSGLLVRAKSGEIRGVAWVYANANDETRDCWVIDERNSYKKVIGEVAVMQTDMAVAVLANSEGSYLTKVIYGE